MLKHYSPSHGCGFASAVVSQKGDHLVFMQVEAQFVQGQFATSLVHLGQFVDTHHQRQVAGLLLDAPHLLWRDKELLFYTHTNGSNAGYTKCAYNYALTIHNIIPVRLQIEYLPPSDGFKEGH